MYWLRTLKRVTKIIHHLLFIIFKHNIMRIAYTLYHKAYACIIMKRVIICNWLFFLFFFFCITVIRYNDIFFTFFFFFLGIVRFWFFSYQSYTHYSIRVPYCSNLLLYNVELYTRVTFLQVWLFFSFNFFFF